jgi:VWFA-related protein
VLRNSRARWSYDVVGLSALAFILVATGLGSTARALATAQPAGTAPKAEPAASSFPAQVELVVVDAVVVNKHGQPVVGLKRSDFVVSENGQPQAISSFETFSAPDTPAADESAVILPVPQRVATNVAAPARAGRSFAVVYDDAHLSPNQGLIARDAVAGFLKQSLRDGDRVTLATTSGTWWQTTMMAGKDDLLALVSRLEGARPEDATVKMSDFEAMRIMQEDRGSTMDASGLTPPSWVDSSAFDPMATYTQEAPGDRPLDVRERVRRRWQKDSACLLDCLREVDMVARQLSLEVTTRSQLTLKMLRRVMDAMATVPGRKSLLLVSAGFVWDPDVAGFKEVIAAARRANTALYFIDVRGLRGLQGEMSAQYANATPKMDVGAMAFDAVLDAAGADGLAEGTGGFSVRNTNEFGKGMGRISDESRVYYLLGYYPKDTKRDGKFRKLSVSVNRHDVTVRARRGYYATEPGQARPASEPEAEAAPEALRAVIDAPVDQGGIPLRLTSYVFDAIPGGKARVLLATEIDVSRLSFGSGAQRTPAQIDMGILVAPRDSSIVPKYNDRIEVTPPTDLTRENWRPIVREFEIPPGVCQAKAVVRDSASGKVGSVTLRFEVPALDGLRVSTPILSDALDSPLDSSVQPKPVLRAYRTFQGGTDRRLYCQYEVYGAATRSGTSESELTGAYILADKAGRPVRWAQPTALTTSATGHALRLIGIPINALPAGEYILALVVEDKIAGKTLELREPFAIS